MGVVTQRESNVVAGVLHAIVVVVGSCMTMVLVLEMVDYELVIVVITQVTFVGGGLSGDG